tara:strand:- start:3298 stop:3585 length:288 start_codon:yes stop_codon:yes gene_type:complete
MARKLSKANKERWAKLREMGCCICMHNEVHVHHVIGHGFGGMGMKAPDDMTIPLCHNHHTGDNGVHRNHTEWEAEFECQLVLLDRVNKYLDNGNG